jgi:hypothetical protein
LHGVFWVNSPSSQESYLSDLLPAHASVAVKVRITKIACVILIVLPWVEFFIGRQNTGMAVVPKLQQTRWASPEAAIKAEINQAKNTFDLLLLAIAIVRLDALHEKWKRPQSPIATAKPEIRSGAAEATPATEIVD